MAQAATASDNEQPWQVTGLRVATTDRGTAVHLDDLDWAGQFQLKDLAYHCPGGLSVYPIHQCDAGELAFVYGPQTHRVKLKTNVNWPQNTWSVSLSNQSDKLQLSLASQSTVAAIDLAQLSLSELLALSGVTWGVGPQPDMLFEGAVHFDWQQGQLSTPQAMAFSGLNYEYSDDVVLADLAGRMQVYWAVDDERLSFDIQIDGGEMLFDQLYVDFSAFPIHLQGQVSRQSSTEYAVHVTAENPQSMQLALDFQLNPQFEWGQPQVAMTVFDSHHFNQQITNSILGIYGFGGSQMSGQFAFSIGSDSQPFDHWSLRFDDYYFLNERRKMAAESLTGQIHWQASGWAPDSALTWQELLLTGLPIGPANAQLKLFW